MPTALNQTFDDVINFLWPPSCLEVKIFSGSHLKVVQEASKYNCTNFHAFIHFLTISCLSHQTMRHNSDFEQPKRGILLYRHGYMQISTEECTILQSMLKLFHCWNQISLAVEVPTPNVVYLPYRI